MEKISLMVSQEQILKEGQQEKYLKQSERASKRTKIIYATNKNVQITSIYH
jgi:hypothetical protein